LAVGVLWQFRLPAAPVLADDGRMETVTIPEVRKSGGLIGAELSGLDLTREYPDETYQAILRAWAEHGVIFLRGQHLDAGQRDTFASKLGEIRVRQEVRKEPEQTKAIGEGWHTDMTCFDEPPKATILFCRVLYVNPEFTTRFEGWTRRESLPLLTYLFDFGTRPEFITRFRWAPGSIAMWDNRQTWHFAVNDYQGQRRVMHRILLNGSAPVAAA
jgi:alpha-ketoglutarate-dependent taurine dioxygenase